MNTQIAPHPYNALRDQIAQLLHEGKERAQQAVEQETVRTYHAIGQVLNDHVLEHRNRADYGDRTIARLAGDVGLSKTLLYQALAFFRLNPIFHTKGKLVWSHYRTLLGAPSDARRYYEEEAFKNGWSVRDLDAQIKSSAFEQAARASEKETPSKTASLVALRGQLHTYRMIRADSKTPAWRLDLGFEIYLDQPLDGIDLPREGQRVTAQKKPSGAYSFVPVAGRPSAFYSYQARVVEVIDGDTLWLDIDCGFHIWTRQKVRLRGIDTPELPTPEGRRATDFVVQALGGAPTIAVTTTRPDKYDRYLADLFVRPEASDPETVLSEGTFLNQALLEAGLATRFVANA